MQVRLGLDAPHLGGERVAALRHFGEHVAAAYELVGQLVVRIREPVAAGIGEVLQRSAQLEPGAWRELTACADLRAVTLLGVRGRYLLDPDHALLQDNDVCMLAASPHVHRLVGLDLGFNAIGDAGLAAIARSPHLAGLRSLQLRGCRYGAAGLQVLANEASFVGLEMLDLSYCEGLPASDPSAGAAGWRAVGNSSRLPALRQLSIAGNAIPDDIQVALARWTASSY